MDGGCPYRRARGRKMCEIQSQSWIHTHFDARRTLAGGRDGPRAPCVSANGSKFVRARAPVAGNGIERFYTLFLLPNKCMESLNVQFNDHFWAEILLS